MNGVTMHFNWILIMMSLVMITNGSQIIGGGCLAPDGMQGICISILMCPIIKSLLIQVASGSIPFSNLRRSICHIAKEPYVCCPLESTSISPPNPFPPATSIIVNPSPTTQSPPDGSPLLPTKCGRQGLVDRIIAGQPAPLGSWPWMAILRGKVDNRSTWHCGGTLVSDRYVLTAAHCIDKRYGIELEFVRIGEHTLQQDPDCTLFGECAPQPQDIPVEQIIKHPSYNTPCNECNDIALLRLSRKVIMHRRYVQPICLPVNPEVDMAFSVQEFQGKVAWASGWGTISQDPRKISRPNVLQQVQLTVEKLPVCNNITRSYPDQRMVLCAGGDGRDTCRGDSGGPLTLTNNVGSKYFLVGITSKGPLVCGAPSTQGIYTSVHHYLGWIMSNLRS